MEGTTPAYSVGTSNITAPNPEDLSDAAFDNLYPAIVRCFVIILCGYMAGRTNMLTGIQGNGIGTYVTKFALPVLLFKSMIELEFSTVNWVFLLCILISKAVIFVAVALFTILLGRPTNYGKAGMFAIFSTQSNDFALGYPIVKALYSNQPKFIQYIYLVAPISLVFLNPIGFILMEIEKRRTSESTVRHSIGRVAWSVVKGIATNPIVFMTVFGLIGNAAFQHNVPSFISQFLLAVSASFEATALFYLGISLVGKFQVLQGYSLMMPVILLAVKLLFLPLLTREIVEALEPGNSDNETQAYATYGFLYSSFPTAPTVFLYASQYDIAKDIVASGLVLCTFVSAPLMFLSAKMITLPRMKVDQFKELITETSRDVSILSLICCIWVVVILLLNRRWKAMPHNITLCLVISQFLGCAGMVLTCTLGNQETWQAYIQFSVFFIGTTASRIWTALLALSICIMRCRSLCSLLRLTPWFYIVGFGLPAVLTGILFLSADRCIENEKDPAFQYGQTQLGMSVAILLLCILTIIISLVYQQRNHRQTDYKRLQITEDNDGSINGDTIVGDYGTCIDDKDDCGACEVGCNSGDVEDIVPKRIRKKQPSEENLMSFSQDEGTLNERTCLVNKCSIEQRRLCLERLRQYQRNNSTLITLKGMASIDNDNEFQFTRHLALLIILTVSMGIGIFLCMWRLFHETPTGIYIELEFLDSVFNCGQGFFTFAIFGLDTQLIIMPFIKRWRKFFYGTETIHLPNYEDLDSEIVRMCGRFLRYHRDQCRADIVKDSRYRFQTFKDVFTGIALVQWLLEVGLARDELDAVTYGQKLLLGRVIKHVGNEHHFHNTLYLYTFTNESRGQNGRSLSISVDESHVQ